MIVIWFGKKDHPLVRYASKDLMAARSGEPISINPTLPLTAAVQTFIKGITGETVEGFGVDLALDVVVTLDECDRALSAQFATPS